MGNKTSSTQQPEPAIQQRRKKKRLQSAPSTSTASSMASRASPTDRPLSNKRLLPDTPNRNSNSSLPGKLRPPSPRSLTRRRSSSSQLSTIHNQLIQKSWKRSQKTGADSIGAKIFLRIFREEPSLKALFGLEQTPASQIKYDGRFRAHASIFTRTLNFVVNNLDDMDSVREHLQDLGRRHVQFQSRGFKPQYWDIFAECLTECAIEWEGGVRCREAMSAWRLLVGHVIDQMRIGFEQQRSTQLELRKLSSMRAAQSPTPATIQEPPSASSDDGS